MICVLCEWFIFILSAGRKMWLFSLLVEQHTRSHAPLLFKMPAFLEFVLYLVVPQFSILRGKSVIIVIMLFQWILRTRHHVSLELIATIWLVQPTALLHSLWTTGWTKVYCCGVSYICSTIFVIKIIILLMKNNLFYKKIYFLIHLNNRK